jgi:hypothetical protein
MKKCLGRIFLVFKWCKLLFLMVMCTFLCGCSFLDSSAILDHGQELANQKFDQVLTSVQSKDADKLKRLFSDACKKDVDNLDASITELFSYFIGNVEAVDDWGACYAETSKEDNQVFQAIEATYDVKTDAGTYRFAIRIISEDTKNSDNIGVQSLYIVKADDTSLEYACWGDGRFTPGIHIGVENSDV